MKATLYTSCGILLSLVLKSAGSGGKTIPGSTSIAVFLSAIERPLVDVILALGYRYDA